MGKIPVTIVVPSYNGLKYADQLIRSLQTYYNMGYEIILIEDGSNDGIKERFLTAFPNAKYFWQENSGPAAARYYGVKEASGEYIQLLDVDDSIEEGKLEAQYNFAINRELDIVYSGWRYVIKTELDSEPEFKPWIVDDQYEDVVTAIFSGWWLPPNAMLISKRAYLGIEGGDLSLRTTEDDIDLYLRLFTRGYSFGYCPGGFANHMHIEEEMSRSSRRSEGWWRDVSKVIMDTLGYLNNKGVLTTSQRLSGLNKLFMAMRNMAKTNMTKAVEIWGFIKTMDPDFSPEGQSALFMQSYHLLGYPLAERLALLQGKLSGKTGYNPFQKSRVYTKDYVKIK